MNYKEKVLNVLPTAELFKNSTIRNHLIRVRTKYLKEGFPDWSYAYTIIGCGGDVEEAWENAWAYVSNQFMKKLES